MGREGGVTERREPHEGVAIEHGGGERDDEKFEFLFRREYPRLVQTLCLTTLDREAAADAAQEAFLQLHLNWDRVSRYGNPAGWVYRVALNRSRDYRRWTLRRFRLSQRQARGATGGQDVSWDPQPDFVRAVKELPDRQRQAAALHYVAGFSQKETAEAMNLSEGAVKSHLFRARETLRRKLEVGG